MQRGMAQGESSLRGGWGKQIVFSLQVPYLERATAQLAME